MSEFLYDPKNRKNYQIVESSYFPGVRALLDPDLEKNLKVGSTTEITKKKNQGQKFNVIVTQSKWGYIFSLYEDVKLKYKKENKHVTIPLRDFKLSLTQTLMDYAMKTLANPPDKDEFMIVRVWIEGKTIQVNPILGWKAERL